MNNEVKRKRREVGTESLKDILASVRGFASYIDWYDSVDKGQYQRLVKRQQLPYVKMYFYGVSATLEDLEMLEQKKDIGRLNRFVSKVTEEMELLKRS